MNGTLYIFLFAAGIIWMGFLGQRFFERTKISDFILLMGIGLLLGPIGHFLPADAVTFLNGVMPFFASLALIILLFEGGLKLNFYQVIQEPPKPLSSPESYSFFPWRSSAEFFSCRDGIR
ncbi:MAG: hypothetical protein HY917_03630 [Candidatus Diapherotrites archaeon]|nr:hypothetical protein [Candidatus Diapherotrites archaeon]